MPTMKTQNSLITLEGSIGMKWEMRVNMQMLDRKHCIKSHKAHISSTTIMRKREEPL